jgi:hypothetical protein
MALSNFVVEPFKKGAVKCGVVTVSFADRRNRGKAELNNIEWNDAERA